MVIECEWKRFNEIMLETVKFKRTDWCNVNYTK